FSTAIERLAESDNPTVVEVIHVSFAENLVWGDEREVRALADLKGTFGPATLQRIAEFEEWAAKFEKWSKGRPGSHWRRIAEVEGWASKAARGDAEQKGRA